MDLLLDVVCIVDAEGRFVFVSAASERVFGYKPEELVGRNMIELVFPDDRERTLTTADEIMRDQPKPHFENRYVRKDGQVVDIMWSARWSEQDRLRLAVARDVTETRQAERKQRALYEICEAAHASDGLLTLYQRIHSIINNLLPADNFCVALYDNASDTVSFPYFVDARVPHPESQRLAADTPIAEVIRGGQAVLMNSADRSGALAHSISPVPSDDGDWLGVPLVTQKGVIGALVLQNYSGTMRYSEKDKDLLHFVSTQVADAIERKQTEARLYHLALHDALTGLPNRTLFNDRVDTALRQARRSGEHLAVLYLDLNEFKFINDAYGHKMGDLLLREVAQRLTRCVRESDTIGRMGGDEFTVLLTNINNAEEVDRIVEKIAAEFTTPFELENQTLAISVSIGSAVYPQHGEEREQLIRQADATMFVAKRDRNQAQTR